MINLMNDYLLLINIYLLFYIILHALTYSLKKIKIKPY